jgi:diacylglycerol kinase family enzyme
MSDIFYYVVFNANAGTANATGVTADLVREIFAREGLSAIVDADSDLPLEERIRRAVASKAQIVVAAGGDGTITALANALVGTSKTLAILPLGTVNALAKDLNVPLKLELAVNALKSSIEQKIDVGEVNGRVFLHKVVVGLIPAMAAGREHIRGRPGIWAKIGFLRYFFRRLARARRMAVAIEPSEGKARVERVQAIAVASNAYDEGFGQIFSRHHLDKGSLTIYVLKHLNLADFFRLATGMLLGRWHDDEALTIESVQAVTINSHKNLVKVMFDGEVETFTTPLVFRIRPLALSVLTPAPADETSAQMAAAAVAS